MGRDGQHMTWEGMYGRRADSDIEEHNQYMQRNAVDDTINEGGFQDVDDYDIYFL
jgi:hypothetical protein